MDWNLKNLASTLTINQEILSLVSEVDEFKGAWQHLGRLNPEKLRNLRRVATVESIGSSTRIEGSRLSDREVEKLLSKIDTYTFASRDEQEVAGYAFLAEEIFARFEVIPFTENVIKQLHGDLLKYSSKDHRHRGEYKTISNHIEAFDQDGKSLGIISEMSSPFNTPRLMQELILWTNEYLENKSLHPLLIVAIFAMVFLAIHPFQDGNGRLSRILTTLLLLKSGYHYVPYSSLESVIEHNKESYYLALKKAQNVLHDDNPDISAWILFFLRGLQKQKVHLELKVSREKNLALHLPQITLEILNLIKEHGKLGVGDIERLVIAPRSTIKKYLNDLIKEGHILRFGKGRATWYELS